MKVLKSISLCTQSHFTPILPSFLFKEKWGGTGCCLGEIHDDEISCFSESMMGVKDWVLSQLVSKSVVSASQLSAGDSFSNNESPNEEFSNRGITLIPFILPDF